MFRFKLPRIFIYAGLIVATMLVLPPLVFANARLNPNAHRPIHLIWDMDFQNKFKTQVPNPLFADNRAMRPLVQGAVAHGEAYTDAHLYEGTVNGQWANTTPARLPMTVALLKRGQERFNIYCSACHGYAGYGDGSVNKRAMELVESASGPVNGTTWVAAKSLHDDTVLVQRMGQIFNTATNGIRNMAGYGAQISTEDRWAIAAYVKALQLSQNATMKLADAADADHVPPVAANTEAH
ncbi:MAG: cytochrome c [Phycisphaerae bacterium]|nr:cytochrome c [Phycisphaerae bacterium]